MKNTNYITIQGWMINELKLSGNDLIIYAVIYGFSQDGQNYFTGSLKYLENASNCSRRTVINVLNRLRESGLLKKEKVVLNDVSFCKYKACTRDAEIALGVVQNLHEGSAEIALGGSAEIAPNNTTLDNSNNTIKERKTN